MFAARWMPRGADDLEVPLPPMWMQLADGAVALHIDWTDQVGGRSTYRITSPVTGCFTLPRAPAKKNSSEPEIGGLKPVPLRPI